MEVPPGALLKAKNTVINRNGIIEPRRGINTYYPMKSSRNPEDDFTYSVIDDGIRAKQLFEYKGSILAHGSYANNESYLFSLSTTYGSDSARYVAMDSYSSPSSPVYDSGSNGIYSPNSAYRIRSEEAKGNFYFTSSAGVRKISSKSADDFNSAFNIEDAGVPKAYAPDLFLAYPSGGFLTKPAIGTSPSKVAYRVLWTYTDNNDNLLFGAPSSRVVIANSNTAVDYNVSINVPIPKEIVENSNSEYYKKFKYRLYRSEILQSASAEPSDELYQVFEGTLSSNTGLTSPYVGYVKVIDTISDIARVGGVPLYTNATSGQGILSSNEQPPSAQDISLFKGHMFYANTTTKDTFTTTLSDLTKINTNSDLTITDGTVSGTEAYKFISQTKAVNTITIVSPTLANYVGKWITLSTPNNTATYSFWFDTTLAQNAVQPVGIPISSIPIRTNIYSAAPTVTTIRDGIVTTINTAASSQVQEFSAAASSTNIAVITNVGFGAANAGSYSFTELTIASSTSASVKSSHNITIVSAVPNDYAGRYITVLSANYSMMYVFWFDTTGTAPVPTINTASGIYITSRVNIAGLGTTAAIASALNTAINLYPLDMTSVAPASVVTVTMANSGVTGTPTYSGSAAQLTIANVTASVSEYTTTAASQVTRLTVNSAAHANIIDHCIKVYSSVDSTRYIFWFDTTVGQTAPVPTLPESYTAIKVNAYGAGSPTSNTLATAIYTAMAANSSFVSKFSVVSPGTTALVNFTCFSDTLDTAPDKAPIATFGKIVTSTSSGIISVSVIEGVQNRILIGSTLEETGRNIVKAINLNENSKYFAIYLSNYGEVQGKILFQKRKYDGLSFILCCKNFVTKSAFTPNLGYAVPNSKVLAGTSATVITTNVGTTQNPADDVFVYGLNYTRPSLPSTLVSSSLNGKKVALLQVSGTIQNDYTVASVDTVDALDPLTYYSLGYTVFLNNYKNICYFTSSSEKIPNRLYYSKYQEHEGVPLLNYIDIGSRDQEILRVIQLRESLFILKEDGVYRLAGDPGSAPRWDVGAFDTTTIIKSPDSAITLGNQCYFLSNQGFMQLNESSIQSISRPIDNKIMPLITTNANLPSLSFSVSYESEKSFMFWTVSGKSDTTTTICYRYNYVTDAWTEWDLSKKCGIVNGHSDKMYLGSSTDNFVEVERKSFDRFDYTDRELDFQLATNSIFGSVIKPNSVYADKYTFKDIDVGDVVAQTQNLTIYQYNSLLKKLDLDLGLTTHGFEAALKMVAGDTLTNKIGDLAARLNTADPSVDYTTLLDVKQSTTLTLLSLPIAADYYILVNTGDTARYTFWFDPTGATVPPSVPGTTLVQVNVTGLSTIAQYITALNTAINTVPTQFSSVVSSSSSVSVTNVVGGVVPYGPFQSSYVRLAAQITTVGEYYAGTFVKNQDAFNRTIAALNTISTYTMFSNYQYSTGTVVYEAVVIQKDTIRGELTLNLAPPFLIVDAKDSTSIKNISVYTGIATEVEYAPQHAGDPSTQKQFSVGTFMFERRSFRTAEVGYNSDISDSYDEVTFIPNNSGVFGGATWGDGTVWGGLGDQAQIRTYIPLRKQRARFLGCKFIHTAALESYALYGLALTYRTYIIPDRTYK